jgi:hypothetical protein
MDGSDLAFRLEEDTAGLWQQKGCSFGNFAGRSNRIAKIGAAAGSYCGMDNCLIPFYQLSHLNLLKFRPKFQKAWRTRLLQNLPAKRESGPPKDHVILRLNRLCGILFCSAGILGFSQHHRYSTRLRTNIKANAAPGTSGTDVAYRTVSLTIKGIALNQYFGRTGSHAKITSLAQLGGYLNISPIPAYHTRLLLCFTASKACDHPILPQALHVFQIELSKIFLQRTAGNGNSESQPHPLTRHLLRWILARKAGLIASEGICFRY